MKLLATVLFIIVITFNLSDCSSNNCNNGTGRTSSGVVYPCNSPSIHRTLTPLEKAP